MKVKIILASKSKARQNLLTQIGLRFIVRPARVKEDRKSRSGYRDLVIRNSLRKAKAVARRFDSGIVIAADTIVICGKRIIGKPKNIDDAYRTLKLLTRKPQWVYSGLAVIDIRRHKVITGCEKTKIYMYPLPEQQIRAYLQRVTPLDKAGSFDIQGRGGIFIDRIEGCYYNVVGLPLAKLARLLERLGYRIF